jgi:hypothetical protein
VWWRACFFFLVYLFILAGLLYLNYVSLIVRVKQHSHVHITADEIGTCCAILSGCGHGLVCSNLFCTNISYHSNKVETAVLVLFFFWEIPFVTYWLKYWFLQQYHEVPFSWQWKLYEYKTSYDQLKLRGLIACRFIRWYPLVSWITMNGPNVIARLKKKNACNRCENLYIFSLFIIR